MTLQKTDITDRILVNAWRKENEEEDNRSKSNGHGMKIKYSKLNKKRHKNTKADKRKNQKWYVLK